MVKACVKICHDVTSLSELLAIVDERRCYGHNAVMFGAVCGCLGISDVEVVRSLFLFNTLRTVIAAAVRLGVVGAIKVCFAIAPTSIIILNLLKCCCISFCGL